MGNLINNVASLFFIETYENHEEKQYLTAIKNILENGYDETGRNGQTRSIFGDCSMKFSLKNGRMPILTTKKMAWKTCLRELLWFIHGSTDNTLLNAQNVHIWDLNSTREFLDKRGLSKYDDGDIGPMYGFQWRHYGAKYYGCKYNYENEGIDQLQNIIDLLKNPETRSSRRILMTAWNANELDNMTLYPCHVLCQFNVQDGNKLSCAFYQRSSDMFLGKPFNIASYAFLTHLLAKHCGLEAHELFCFNGNCHIYDSHLDAVKEQLTREAFPFPTIEIDSIRENINDYTVDDFIIRNYKCHPPIKALMVA
jgi:thymidylate synthase